MKNVSGPRSFFSKVMGIKAKKPRPKGKQKKLKKIKTHKKKIQNILKVYAGSGDLTQDTATKNKWIQKHLSGLTKDQLKKLKRKIDHISHTIFDEQDEQDERIQKIQEVTNDYVEFKLKQSSQNKAAIRRRIERRMDHFSDLDESEVTRQFVRAHFADILDDYSNKVEDGRILPNPEEKRPAEFIINHIKKKII